MYREARAGLDLPASFMDEVVGIDKDLHFIWHQYRCIYDDVINRYYGEIENPRFTISESYGYTNFGFALTDNKGNPISEEKFHIWRYCPAVSAWAHVIDIASKEPKHLHKVVNSLARSARLADMNRRERLNFLQDEQEEQLVKKQTEGQDLWNEVNKANSKLLKTAADNFASGIVAPTSSDVTIDKIISYKGQKNRTRISRTRTDSEAQIILPDNWKGD